MCGSRGHKGTESLKASGTTHPTKQRHIQDDYNLHLKRVIQDKDS
jgi:hypothetical protein